ncbi:MAG: hypothetical protein MJE63_03545 [Proteobacteria bacterium]|nr:hypothetical protein [Pseudomonadota bacterium]
MKIYHYNEKTHEYVWEGIAEPNIDEPGQFIIPENSTDIAPPQVQANQAAVFSNGEWNVVADYRQMEFFNKETHERLLIENLGETPGSEYTPIQPGKYDIWDVNTNEWTVSLEAVRAGIIKEIKDEAYDLITENYDLPKQMNINSLQGYSEQERTDMWAFINSIREQSKNKVTEVNNITSKDQLLNYNIDFEK